MSKWEKGYWAFFLNKMVRWYNSVEYKEGWQQAQLDTMEAGFSTAFNDKVGNPYKFNSFAYKAFQKGAGQAQRGKLLLETGRRTT